MIIIGIFSFVTVFSIMSVLKPIAIDQLPNSDLILIYKANCPHCEKVEKFIKEKHINISNVDASNCLSLLKSLSINAVPALISKKMYKIEVLIGDKAIIKYLLRRIRYTTHYNIPEFYGSNKNNFCTINSKHCH